MQKELMAGTAKSRLAFDPRTKIFVLLVITVVMMGGTIEGVGIIVRPVLALIPFLLLLIEGKRKGAWMFLLLFMLASFGESWVLPHTAGAVNLILVVATGLVTRFLPCFMMGYYLVTTTVVSEFIAAMERLHITKKIVIPLSVMFRFFPTVLEEAHAVRDSMRMRGIGGAIALKSPVKALEYRVVPLMVSVVKIGEELSASALTRGLGNPGKRTNICHIGFHLRDLIFFAAAGIPALCTVLF